MINTAHTSCDLSDRGFTTKPLQPVSCSHHVQYYKKTRFWTTSQIHLRLCSCFRRQRPLQSTPYRTTYQSNWHHWFHHGGQMLVYCGV